jgi:hypothetical protein
VQRSCFPPKILSQHWPPSLRWVQVPNPFPTFIATMRPSDSPAASARLRFALGRALPVGQALVLCPVAIFLSRHVAGRRSACSRRRVGEGHRFSVARIFQQDIRGLPGYRAVLFERATCHPPRRSPFDSPSRLREYCFPGEKPLEHQNLGISGLTQVAHSLAWLRFNRPLARTTASLATSPLATLWLGGDRTHWTTHQSFSPYPDLLSDRHSLVASLRHP